MADKTVNVSPWSIAALQIEMYFDDTLLSHGTGSIWSVGQRSFLITNWHNVSGRHRETGEHLSNTAAEPNKLVVHVHSKEGAGKYNLKPLRLRDENDKSLWLEHPSDPKVDLVAIPIEVDVHDIVNYVNQLSTTELSTYVGSDLFIVGFPFKLDQVGFPVWKRATLASEPELKHFTNTKYLLVDTATRGGMSGSLVFRQETGNWVDGKGNAVMSSGQATFFLGVYSGRLGANTEGDAQLGIVWPSHFVEEILAQVA